MEGFPIFMDYNATTPVHAKVLEWMMPTFRQHFGNPSSTNHAYGWAAAEYVNIAREEVAALAGAETSEILFTSGATEAINLAIKGAAKAYRKKGNHIITYSTEHKAVMDTCKFLESEGYELTYLGVDANGNPDLAALENAITPNTILIAAMYANNETGVIFPIKEMAALAIKHNILFFSDATQAAGKIPLNFREDGISMACISAHKIYGPKGAGALYISRRNPRVSLIPIQHGGGHERGFRSGTLNVSGIAGLGKACALAVEEMGARAEKLMQLRNRLEEGLLKIEGAFVNGAGERLPNVANIGFRGVDGIRLLSEISKHIAVSSGSACTSALPQPSHVLKAMGRSDAEAAASLRFSLGIYNTEEEVDRAIEAVRETVNILKAH